MIIIAACQNTINQSSPQLFLGISKIIMIIFFFGFSPFHNGLVFISIFPLQDRILSRFAAGHIFNYNLAIKNFCQLATMLVHKYFEAKSCYSREGSWKIFFGHKRQKINLGHRWYIISEMVGKLINKDNVCRIGKYGMRRFLVVHTWNQSSSNTQTSHYLNSLMLFGGEGVYSMMKENSTIKSYEFLIQGQKCEIW